MQDAGELNLIAATACIKFNGGKAITVAIGVAGAACKAVGDINGVVAFAAGDGDIRSAV